MKVDATAVAQTNAATRQGFVAHLTGDNVKVYTHETRAYNGLPRGREAVKHSVQEFAKGQAHAYDIKSFRSKLKSGRPGTYH